MPVPASDRPLPVGGAGRVQERDDGRVSIEVALDDLPATVAERGPAAYLVSSGETRPRVVSVAASWADGALVVGAGRRTAANIAARPDVTVFWPAGGSHPDHSLLVDGRAEVGEAGETIIVTPASAILHRSRSR